MIYSMRKEEKKNDKLNSLRGKKTQKTLKIELELRRTEQRLKDIKRQGKLPQKDHGDGGEGTGASGTSTSTSPSAPASTFNIIYTIV